MIKLLIVISLLLNIVGLNFVSSKDKLSSAIRADESKIAPVVSAIQSLPEIVTLPSRLNVEKEPTIYAKNYLLLEEASNEILYSKSALDRVPIASTTKITTATVVLENYKLTDVVTISQKAATQIGSDSNLISGEKMTVENLLYCLLLKSGNDAAYALAEHYQEGVEGFVELMNKKAKDLKMKDTHYLDPAGLNPSGYSSAYDLSIITRYALKKDQFRKFVATPEIQITNVEGNRLHDLKNSNRLVNDFAYPGAIGVKTGYLPEAGHCLVGAADRDGHRLVAIILNTTYDTPTASALEARKLLDFGFENFKF